MQRPRLFLIRTTGVSTSRGSRRFRCARHPGVLIVMTKCKFDTNLAWQRHRHSAMNWNWITQCGTRVLLFEIYGGIHFRVRWCFYHSKYHSSGLFSLQRVVGKARFHLCRKISKIYGLAINVEILSFTVFPKVTSEQIRVTHRHVCENMMFT